jgi:hypothetical protein
MKYTCEDLTDTAPYGIPAALRHADPTATHSNPRQHGVTYEHVQALKKLVCTTYTKQIPAGPSFDGGTLTLPECNYDYDASPAICPTVLLSGAPIPFQGGGTARNVGAGRDNGHLKSWGHFTLPKPVRLNQATLTLTHLIEEMADASDLLQGLEGASLLPMTLKVRTRSTQTEAVYGTLPGVRPRLKVAVKTQDPETGAMKFAITVHGAVISEPAKCADAPTTELATTFGLLVGSEHVLVGARLAWECHESTLQTP